MSHARISPTGRAHTVIAGLALATLAAGTIATSAEAASAATAGPSAAHLRIEVAASVNKVRAQHGCKALKVAKKLNKAAQGHAEDMADTDLFSHTSADGRSWVTRIRNAGWRNPAGENIAHGFDSASSVMTAWMNSPEHRRNILNCSFRYIGVGYTTSGAYWVQDFGY